MPPHKVVALVSGGKDSCYSMMKCVAHGHTVVALANLHPKPEVGEELDSLMYQTVGHAHVGAIAEAMELPIFRREITGTAVEQGLRYGATAGDEVEDLHALLSEVVEKMPEVTAVCSGAILSSYQRSRVESCCERLGLASLAYMWQREQGPLLDEMIANGIDAVLVKVASLGLTGQHLGRSLSSLRGHFDKLEKQFGFHVCGEGGEYETFTLDCPLFKKRIEPKGSEVQQHGGGAALLSWKEGVTLVEKGGSASDAAAASSTDITDEQEEDDDEEAMAVGGDDGEYSSAESKWTVAATADDDLSSLFNAISLDLGYFSIHLGGGLVHATACGGGLGDDSADTQLTNAVESVALALRSHGLTLSDVLMTRLYVSDMGDYASVNKAFAESFKDHQPAARLAVQCPLSAAHGDRCKVAIEVTAWACEKQLLHVQSISEWAPRMIGPYCQLTVGYGVCYVAGSIGLRPAEMVLVDGGAVAQAELALKNVAQVLSAGPRDGEGMSAAGALTLTMYITRTEDAVAVRAAALNWLRKVTDQPKASSEQLPPVVMLQIGALPMGALVEAQLEATPPDLPPLYTDRFNINAGGFELACSVNVAGGLVSDDEDDKTTSACGSAFVLVKASDDSPALTMAQLGGSLSKCLDELDTRLRGSSHELRMERSVFIRAIYDERLCHLKVGGIAEAATASRKWKCEALALPVVRVLAPGSRILFQVQFTASMAAPPQGKRKAKGPAMDVS